MAFFDCIVGGSGKGNTLVVTCADDLAGATITCTNGTKTYTKTCPSTAPYEVTFYGLMAGTWTISATVSGNTYTTTVVVADIEALLGGFSWKTWVDTARFLDSSDYDSLDEVLADELALRELALEHACVDYMAEIATASADVETIINTDLFAKWVNNSDYALDYLYANEIIADYMDDADKYFYGEWVITDSTTTPVTWGPKGNVPVMTSNTAPYGECISNGTDGTAYKAFDNNDSTESANSSYGTSGGQRLGYKFTNPVNVKKLHHTSGAGATDTIKVQYSDNGTTWIDTGDTFTNTLSVSGGKDIDVTDSGYHLYWGIYCTGSTTTSRMSTKALQFYGRELSVSVPEMTSDTTPYGECIWSTEAYYAWYSFNTNDSINIWQPSDGVANNRIGYKFTHPVVAKKVHFTSYASANDQTSLNMKIQGYDGTNWVTLSTFTLERATAIKVYDIDLTNDIPYEAYCLFTEDVYRSSTSPQSVKQLEGIQFYGLDYSEKEFEEGTTKKWLYDHGVELETMTAYHNGSTTVAEKRSDELLLSAVSDDNKTAEFYAPQIDFTPYSLMRCKVGKEAIVFNGRIGQLTVHSDYIIPVNNIGAVANALIVVDFLPYNAALDVSSLNATYYPILGQNNGGSAIKGTFTELWLE